MIRKLSIDIYMKRTTMMTGAEKKEYLNRVGEWYAQQAPMLLEKANEAGAVLQNISQCSIAWNDVERKAWDDGAILLSALYGHEDTWLPDKLYTISAKRCIRRMVDCLQRQTESKTKESDKTVPVVKEPEQQPQKTDDNKQSPSDTTAPDTSGNIPPRPKHIDQYVHLLPPATQERAAQVRTLLRDLDDARQNLNRLIEAKECSDKTEMWARKATRLDNAVKKIFQEIDTEWEKVVATGRVGVDDFGNAYVKDMDSSAVATEQTPDIVLTSEQKQRRRDLRKWLTDTRRGNGDTREEHLKKWNENFKEYLTLEPKEKAMADQKILEAAKHYGIELKN